MAASDFTYKWLVWDGSYTLRGTCNLFSDDASELSTQTTALLPTLQIPLEQNPKQPSPSIVAATAISVRLLKIVELPGLVAIKTQLKRLKKSDDSWNIKSLMLRVYRSYDLTQDKNSLPKEKLVYQEILTKEQLDLLANAKKDDDSGIPTELNPWLSTINVASIADSLPTSDSPYKVRVWVSTKKNAFGKAEDDYLPYLDEPQSRYTIQVHDQYQPTEAEFLEKFKLGTNDASWEEFLNKRKTKEKAGKYDDQPGRNITQLAYRTMLAPTDELPIVQATLERAAQSGMPFTKGLIEMAVSVPT